MQRMPCSLSWQLPRRGGSNPGKSRNKKRDFVAAYSKLVKDYFSGEDSIFSEADFERCFRMKRAVFTRIWTAVEGYPPFVQRRDATGKLGIHPLCRFTACLRYLAYGDAYDREDENLYISETSLMVSVKALTKIVKQLFGSAYLNRCPTRGELEAICKHNANKGFPGLFASWDCKHFNWKNCPMRLAGQHVGHAEGGKKTLILESISDHRRFLWYTNFGDPGSLNDTNVLDKSSIVYAIMAAILCLVVTPYVINGTERDHAYFLTDGIYPEWSIFVKTFQVKSDPKKQLFGDRQEAVRKDIECAFGILVQKFHILQRPLRNWYLDEMKELLECCVIFHNIVVEDRCSLGEIEPADDDANRPFPLFGQQQITAAEAAADGVDLFAARAGKFGVLMESSYLHYQLKQDLVEHIWSRSR